MRKFKVWVDTGQLGSEKEEEFEMEDDATEKEIKKEALEILFNNLINYGYNELED